MNRQHEHRTLSEKALAARSMRLADQVKDPAKHAAAVREHYDRFAALRPMRTTTFARAMQRF